MTLNSGTRGAFIRIEARAAASPDRDAYNKPLFEWAEFRSVFVSLVNFRQPVERTVGGATGQTQSFISWTAIGDYYDLDGVTTEMRVVYDPLGTYDTESRKVYFDIEGVLPDMSMMGDSKLALLQKLAPGASR